ncbi:tetratricopeptide repeat protein [Stutzerimonas kunmingensis]|jgi:MSHA biogenesis protein MshN|uniref:tetratricopeptide repeat protein n=1 Tax=Stutzerimonas kunmingensis TaxID=1211807 RepID=UPI001747CA60|nr:tetratricopeptide repeat protein [Stutzerimonas kunmingensis]MBD3876146.1 tetratricopeptide repeat protein [Stutzerimonas kunmingensis]|tara:strand:+ start:7602 stop:8966 length:1365 start_codon:yes stop_codon:yes gene_type:complete
MSLVNDMLRDLEARGAASGGQSPFLDMQAVDETAATRRQRSARLRRWLLPLAIGALVVAASVVLFERFAQAPAVQELPAAAPVVAAVPATQLLDVLPQQDGGRFVLQLLLDRSISYQRTDEGGAISLLLPDVALAGGPRNGRVESNGLSLSWRVEQQGDQVQVLLLGITDRLDVRDRLEPAAGHAQLWLEVRMDGAPVPVPEDLDLPFAEPALDEASLPDWVTRTAPDAQTAPPVAPDVQPVAEPAPAPVARPQVATTPTVQIGSHRPDPLAQARDALQQQNFPRAIELLQALHAAQPDNAEAARWLARAYLAAGQIEPLLEWLPAQLQRRPFDAELRMLLARGQLQGGDKQTALATLVQNAPSLASDPGYHALLAALQQQVGDWAGSAAVYRQLVALQPQQAAWQLGLAIALEQIDQPARAARHYRLAAQGQGLDDNSRRFAAERAGVLGGAR